MPAAARYIGMFRAAAVFFVLFGSFAIWRYGFTGYAPEQKPLGLGIGLVVLLVGIFLFRRARVAIGLSVLGAGFVCLAATLALARAQGPLVLLFAALALLTGLYMAFSLRVLFGGASDAPSA